ncbi:hypothetical protein RCZ04_16740 [Capnocytophaga sp. HP1101]
MVLILIIILGIVFWFYKANVKKRLRNSYAQKTLNWNTPSYIRKYWKEVRIDAEHCDIMNENTTFDLQAVEDNRMKSNFEETMLFTEAMLFSKLRLGEEKLKLSYIRCYDKSTTPVKVYQTTVTDIDASVAQVKLNVQGYINVYYNPQDPKEVYIDTEFLQKDLTELMNP